jgi:hypothetical protein
MLMLCATLRHYGKSIVIRMLWGMLISLFLLMLVAWLAASNFIQAARQHWQLVPMH